MQWWLTWMLSPVWQWILMASTWCLEVSAAKAFWLVSLIMYFIALNHRPEVIWWIWYQRAKYSPTSVAVVCFGSYISKLFSWNQLLGPETFVQKEKASLRCLSIFHCTLHSLWSELPTWLVVGFLFLFLKFTMNVKKQMNRDLCAYSDCIKFRTESLIKSWPNVVTWNSSAHQNFRLC